MRSVPARQGLEGHRLSGLVQLGTAEILGEVIYHDGLTAQVGGALQQIEFRLGDHTVLEAFSRNLIGITARDLTGLLGGA